MQPSQGQVKLSRQSKEQSQAQSSQGQIQNSLKRLHASTHNYKYRSIFARQVQRSRSNLVSSPGFTSFRGKPGDEARIKEWLCVIGKVGTPLH